MKYFHIKSGLKKKSCEFVIKIVNIFELPHILRGASSSSKIG